MSVGKYWDEYWNPDGESWQLGRGRTSLLHRTARLAAAGLPGSWQGSLGTSPSETRGQPWGRHGTWRPVGARLAEAGLACQEAGEGERLEDVRVRIGSVSRLLRYRLNYSSKPLADLLRWRRMGDVT